MKRFALGALVAGSLAGCGDVYEADPARTARADSSAAGYVIAELAVAGGRASSPSEAAHQPARSPAAAGPTARDSGSSTPAASDSSATTGIREAPDPVPATSGAAPGDTVRGAPELRTRPESLPADQGDSIVVDTFLAFDPVGRIVWFDLIAGYDGANGSLNFNGGQSGSHTLVVPAGWRVEVRFANRDHDLPHSATVVRYIDPIPVMAPSAFFPGAFSVSLEEGIAEGRTDTFQFSADRQGRYLVMCAVPGHGQGGMWIRLEVSSTAERPRYRR